MYVQPFHAKKKKFKSWLTVSALHMWGGHDSKYMKANGRKFVFNGSGPKCKPSNRHDFY